jgi:hypothetical protein
MLNESEILESITRIYDLMQEKQVNGLQVVGNSLLLCDRIAAKLKQVKNDFELDVGQLTIWKMLTYVQQNFSEKITIDAISNQELLIAIDVVNYSSSMFVSRLTLI